MKMPKLPDEIIRMLAIAERMMDEGKVPFVMADSPLTGKPERMPVSKDIMEKFGLQNGQSINSIIFEAITQEAEKALKKLYEDLKEQAQAALDKKEDENLDPNFDFRSMLDESGDDPTKH